MPASTCGGSPHAGGGPDVAKMGLPAPDPNRPIDPTHHVKGMIAIEREGEASLVKPGTAVFVIVKRADATGRRPARRSPSRS